MRTPATAVSLAALLDTEHARGGAPIKPIQYLGLGRAELAFILVRHGRTVCGSKMIDFVSSPKK